MTAAMDLFLDSEGVPFGTFDTEDEQTKILHVNSKYRHIFLVEDIIIFNTLKMSPKAITNEIIPGLQLPWSLKEKLSKFLHERDLDKQTKNKSNTADEKIRERSEGISSLTDSLLRLLANSETGFDESMKLTMGLAMVESKKENREDIVKPLDDIIWETIKKVEGINNSELKQKYSIMIINSYVDMSLLFLED